MGWLTKVAQIILKITAVATGFAPLLQGAIGGTQTAKTVNEITDDLTKLGGVVTTVEAVFAAMGDQANTAAKIKASIPLLAQVVLASELMIGKKVHDEALFEKSLTELASGVSDLLNSVQEA